MIRLVLAIAVLGTLGLPAAAQTGGEKIKEIILIDTLKTFCDIDIIEGRTIGYIADNKLKAVPGYIAFIQEGVSQAGEVQHTLEDAGQGADGVVCTQFRDSARDLGLLRR